MKNLAYLLVSVLISFFLYGCGGDASKSSANEETQETVVASEDDAVSEDASDVDENVPETDNLDPLIHLTAEDFEKMSAFVSNFSELGLYNFTTKELLDDKTHSKLIRFGIWHNYLNHFNSRIVLCEGKSEDCPYGMASIDSKYVTESIKKYFDVDFKDHKSVKPEVLPSYREYTYYYDGKLYHFDPADGEAVYHALVKEGALNPAGDLVMKGVFYLADDETDQKGHFVAVAKHSKYEGGDTWAILSMKSEF